MKIQINETVAESGVQTVVRIEDGRYFQSRDGATCHDELIDVGVLEEIKSILLGNDFFSLEDQTEISVLDGVVYVIGIEMDADRKKGLALLCPELSEDERVRNIGRLANFLCQRDQPWWRLKNKKVREELKG